MPILNLLEYTLNYSMTSGSLWNYYRDKIDDVEVNDSASDGKSFKTWVCYLFSSNGSPSKTYFNSFTAKKGTIVQLSDAKIDIAFQLKY